MLAVAFCACHKTQRKKDAPLPANPTFQTDFAEAMAAKLAECAHVTKQSIAGMYELHALARFNSKKALEAKRVAFFEGAAKLCLEEIKKSACDKLGFELESIPPACARVYDGRVKDGQDCYHTIECQAGMYCAMPGGACPGKCAAKAGAGSACEDDTACEAGLHCVCANAACATRVCRASPKLGGDCGSVERPPCPDDTYCQPRGASRPFSCLARLPVGGKCVTSDACRKPLRCVGLESVKKPGTCRTPKALGEACVAKRGECSDNAACLPSAKDPKKTVCTPLAAPGGTCGVINGEPQGCVGGYCDLEGETGTCRAYKRPGEGCDYRGPPDVCGSGRCDTFTHACVYSCVEK